jgi:hypothetical protein
VAALTAILVGLVAAVRNAIAHIRPLDALVRFAFELVVVVVVVVVIR